MTSKPLELLCGFFRYTKMYTLPKQLGTSVLHVPREVHSVSAVPFRTKPSSQVDLHWEPKLNSWWRSEQIKDPWEGGFRVGHRLAAGEQREGMTAYKHHVVKLYQKEITKTCYDKDVLLQFLFYFLPKQCDISALHMPRELQSVLVVPFSRTKPLSQATVHREPKLNGPFGSEQDREPWGRFIGMHFLAWRNQGRDQLQSHSTCKVVKL